MTQSRRQAAGHGRWWRYLPLTCTPHKLLTFGFATPWCSPALCAPRPSAKRPGSLRDGLDECDIAELIIAYREGATTASSPLTTV
jgi:hypothetical protein